MRRSVIPRVVAAGALGLLPLCLAGSARAASTASLGGWNISADGNVIDFLFDNATGLAGVHPFTEADFPEAESQFQTGPFGSGLATMFWPGSAGGNFGSLSAELGIPTQLQPVTSMLNDPVRAQTQYPAGPQDSTYPTGGPSQAFEAHSTSTATGTTATAAINDVGASGAFTYTLAKGTSSAAVDQAGHAVATSSSDLTGVSILGMIDIGSVTSTATATSDGNKSSGQSTTHVGEITVAGQKASIGTDGLILPDFAKSLGPVLGPLVQRYVNQVITDAGITITTLPGLVSHNGASDSVTSGALQIKIVPPPGGVQALENLVEPTLLKVLPPQAAILATLPGIFQGSTFTITLGRAIASTAASPPFNLNFTLPPLPTPNTFGSVPSTSGVSTPASAPVTGAGASPALSQPAPASTTPTQPASAAAVSPISLSSPLAIAAIVLGALVTLALASGLWWVGRNVLPEDSGPVCPLGQENP